MTRRDDEPLTTGELNDLAQALDHITTDLLDRLAIAATDPWAHTPITGPHVQSQPRSRPPFAVSAEVTLSALRETLSVTVRAISEHRHTPLPDVATVVQAAAWVRKHRIALATMPDGRTLHGTLLRVVEHAARGSIDEQTMHVTPRMVADANRQLMTAHQIARLGHQLGEQAHGLTYERIRTLVRRAGLKVADTDHDSGTHFYRLGDVLAAHKTYTRRKPSTRRRAV